MTHREKAGGCRIQTGYAYRVHYFDGCRVQVISTVDSAIKTEGEGSAGCSLVSPAITLGLERGDSCNGCCAPSQQSAGWASSQALRYQLRPA